MGLTRITAPSKMWRKTPFAALKRRPRTVDFSCESERLALVRESGGSVSAYLNFFELEQSPFEGKAQSQVVLGTRALREAFGAIRSGLEAGDSRICVSGRSGLGKTSLARALPKLLGDEARVANVLDAGLAWAECRDGIARQWGLGSGRLSRASLVEARANRQLVLVVDQAERADEDFLDHLDVLLSYRTEADTPVVQSVLLANLATREGEAPVPLLWWLDRIQTLQLEFAPLPRDGVASYIAKHLRRAGWRGEALFSETAGFAIHGYTGGIPGEISALCENLLVEAASQGCSEIDADFVHAICDPQPTDGEETLEGAEPAETDPEAAWTVPDEFEALMAEGEFSGAEGAAGGVDTAGSLKAAGGVDTAGSHEATETTDPTESLAAADEKSPVAPIDAAPATAANGESKARIDAPGTDETAVLRVEDDDATEDEEADGALVFTNEHDRDPLTGSREATGAPAPPHADAVGSAEAHTPRNLADALEFFESAAGSSSPEDEIDAPIELADVVEAPAPCETTDSRESEGRWTFAPDEAETKATAAVHPEAATEAAFVPEDGPNPLELLEAPLTDDERAAFEGRSTSQGRKPFVLAALAAAVAGVVFLSFGGSDSPAPAPSPMIAKNRPSTSTPLLATPGQGFVDREVIDRLPKDALAEAVAAAEALAPHAGMAEPPTSLAAPRSAVRPTAPLRETAKAGPEAARLAGTGPTVTDEARAKTDPPADSTDADETQAAIPASPSALPAPGQDERFW